MLFRSNGYGATANWSTATKSIPVGTPTADYKFVFVSGSWDQSGGTALGAKLFVDSIATTSTASVNLFQGTVCTTCRISANTVSFTGDVNFASTAARLSIASASTITGTLSGTGGLIKDGAGALTITGTPGYSGATTITNSSLIFKNNAAPSTSGFSGANAQLTIEPDAASASFASALALNYTYGAGLTSLTIGKTGNTSNITTSTAVSVAGPIRIFGGNVTINGALTTTDTSTGDVLLQGADINGTGGFNLATGRKIGRAHV